MLPWPAISILLSLSLKVSASPKDKCVEAWVRAEDLRPNTVSQGELRIKVKPSCADSVDSVALRLQYDEFAEVKYKKHPNRDITPDFWWPTNTGNLTKKSSRFSMLNYDYDAESSFSSDPDIWGVVAEERHVWSTQAVLVGRNKNLSDVVIKPFKVSTPNVNYPPTSASQIVGQANQDSASDARTYRYFAVVQMKDGKTLEVPAGYTTFRPTGVASPGHISRPSVFTSLKFEEACYIDADVQRCLPESQRAQIYANVSLESGAIIMQGSSIKGKISIYDNSTEVITLPTRVLLHFSTESDQYWARTFISASVNETYPAANTSCDHNLHKYPSGQDLDPHSCIYNSVFGDEDCPPPRWDRPFRELSIPENQSIEFEIPVDEDAIPSILAYYSNHTGKLSVLLSADVPREVELCVSRKSSAPAEIPEESLSFTTEDGMWDMWTPIGKQARNNIYSNRLLRMSLPDIPITVVSKHSQHGGPPPMSYLDSNATSPVIFTASASGHKNFPRLRPVIVQESPNDTVTRLLDPNLSDPFYWGTPNHSVRSPSFQYRLGGYAGLLWRKKVVEEERRNSGTRSAADPGQVVIFN